MWWGWLLYSVVLLWLMPGACWRVSGLALLTAWTAAEAYHYATGVQVSVPLYIVADLLVIGAILYTPKHWTDWAILCIFPVQWAFYVADVTARQQWIALYWLALLQFVLAGPWRATLPVRNRQSREPAFVPLGG